MVAAAAAPLQGPSSLVFVYGTLKHGFFNHILMEDLIATGHAAFVASCRTLHHLPLVCGPYRVPFLLNLPGRGQRVSGELYAVSAAALARMDELEGLTRGHYERLPIDVDLQGDDDAAPPPSVEAYYAHRSYAEALWRRNGEEGYDCYTEKVARGYVRRKDRPHHLTFLDQIRLFIEDSPARPEPANQHH